MSAWTDQNVIFLNLTDEQLLALTAYGEAAQEGTEGLMGVINTIHNRSLYSEFRDSEIYGLTGSAYKAVILKPYQFSMYNLNDPVRQRVIPFASNFDAAVGSNAVLDHAYQLAQMLTSGQLSDNTGGATHYHATYVSPSWAPTLQLLGRIGNHVFYASRSVERGPGVLTALTAGFGGGSPTLWLFIIGAAIGLYFMRRR